jgi:Kinesin motor domain
MIDLAGSEDLRRSGGGNEEQRLAEARSINSSLSTLGKVVMLLSSGSGDSMCQASHIPFRDSKLTRILKAISLLLGIFYSNNMFRFL